MITSYVLVETVALLQHRFGVEAVRDLHERVLPLVRMHGVTESLHRRAMASLLRSDRGRVSFVDHVSFGFMMGAGIRTAFTLDRHFAEAGFEVLPA